MAPYVRPIFHLPSFFFANDSLSPTEYCQSLTFLPDNTDPDCEEFDDWRRTPWFPCRTSPRRAVARVLHYGSTPDFNIDFEDSESHCRPKNKYAVIGTGRPKPKTFGEEFAYTDETSTDDTGIKLESARLARTKASKFAKLFPPSAAHEETTFTDGVDESIWNVTSARPTGPKVSAFAKVFPSSALRGDGTFTNGVDESIWKVTPTDTISPYPTQSMRDITRSRRPWLESHGDMSNLRPHDRGMDAATCAKFLEISNASERYDSFVTTSSDNSGNSTSEKVTFDLRAEYDTGSIAEQKAECRTRAHQMNMEEALASIREVNEEISRLGRRLHLFNWLMCDAGTIGEWSEIYEDFETDEDEEERGSTFLGLESEASEESIPAWYYDD